VLAVAVALALSAGAQAAPIYEAKIGGGQDGLPYSEAAGVYTIQGSGHDIWDSQDDFYFVYQEFDASESLDISAEVLSFAGIIGAIHDWAKGGVMIRNSLDRGSRNACTVIANADGNGINAQIRRDDDTGSAGATGTGPRTAHDTPAFVRLEYPGDGLTFTSYWKTNAGDPWNLIGTNTLNDPLTGTIYMGLAVTSHDNARLTEVQFDNVTGFVLAPPAAGTLVWDGTAGSANWGTANWLPDPPPGPPPPPSFPDNTIIAGIDTPNTVTVASPNREAHTLNISNSGVVAIGAGNTLTVVDAVNASDGTVALENNATLATQFGGGGIGTLTTNGNATIDVAATLRAETYDDQATPGMLTKRGDGTLRLGTLPSGATDITLDGGSLELMAPASYAAGLLGGHQSGDMDFGPNSGNLGTVSGPLGGRSGGEHWSDVIGPGTSTLVYTGQIYLAGPTTFVESIDDKTFLNIAGTTVLNDTGWDNTTHGTYTPAAADWYDVEIRLSNGGGGYGPVQQDGWTESYGFGIDPAGNDNEDEANFFFPEDPGDASLFRVASIGPINMTGSDVTVLSDSTLNALTNSTADFGNLIFTPTPAPGQAILRTSGAPDGMSFLGTTITAGDTVGFNTETDTTPGAIAGGGLGATIVKSGPAELILNQAGSGLGGATFDVQDGRLVSLGLAPIGPAAVQLSGGEFALTSPGGDLNVTNPLTVVSDSGMHAGQFAGGVGGPVLVTLSDLDPDASILTLRATDGYSFGIPGALPGTGGIDVAQGPVRVDEAMDIGTLILSGGQLVRTGAGTPDGDVTVRNELRLDGGSLDMTGNSLNTDFNTDVDIRTGSTLTVPHNLNVDELLVRNGNLVLPPGGQVNADNRYLFEYDTDYTLGFDLVGDADIELRGNNRDRIFYPGDHFQTTSNRITYLHRGGMYVEDISQLADGNLRFHADNTDHTTVLMMQGEFTLPAGSGAGQVSWDNNGGGWAAKGGPLTVRLWDDATHALTMQDQGWDTVRGRRLMFQHRYADNQLEFQNDLYLRDGTQRIRVYENPDLPGEDTMVTLSGHISSHPSGNNDWFDIRGNGTVWFTDPTNDYLQRTNLYDGVTLRVGLDAAGLGPNRLRFSGPDSNGTVLEGHGVFTRDIANSDGNNVYWQEDGGFSAYGGKFTITLEGGNQLKWGSGGEGFRGRRLHFGSRTANDVVELTNDIDGEGGERYVYAFDNPQSPDDYAIMSGALTNFRIFRKHGDGLLEVSNDLQASDDIRAYDGGTLLLSGTAFAADDLEVRGGASVIVSGNTVINNDITVEQDGSRLIVLDNGLPTTFSLECGDDIRVRSGAATVLGGDGSIFVDDELDIENRAILAPGDDGIGTLNVEFFPRDSGDRGFRMENGSTYECELGANGDTHDLVDILGDLRIDSTWTLRLFDAGLGTVGTPGLSPDDELDLFTYSDEFLGSLGNYVIDTSNFDLTMYQRWNESGAQILHDATGKRVYLTGLLAMPIPEPGTCVLLGAGLLALVRRRRRKK